MLRVSVITLLFFGLSIGLETYGQEVHISSSNGKMTPFVNVPFYSINDGQKYNDPEFYNHPDFGKMTFNAPEGKRVVEVIGKRSVDERFYIDLDDPTFFYIEKSGTPLNIFDGQFWRAIDASLYDQGNGFYQSGFQPYVTELDLSGGYSKIRGSEGHVQFNNVELRLTMMDNSIQLIDADWSNALVNNFGCFISDIFPGIDMKLTYSERRVKSDFIIKSPLPGVKSIAFIDHLELSENYELFLDQSGSGSSQTDLNEYYLQIYDLGSGDNIFVVDPARSYDNSNDKVTWLSAYELHGHDLYTICDSSVLNNPNLQYPLTIDPTFVAVGPVYNGFPVMGSLVYPAACTDNLVVNFPGGSTPWDADVEVELFADFCAFTAIFPPTQACWASDAGFWVSSSCGGLSPAGAPGTSWGCTVPACNAGGGWLLNTGFNGTGTQSLVQCYTPSCLNQNMTFTLNFTRYFCPTYAPYDNCNWNNSYCVSLDNWGITIQGRTTETLGNTATGNGYQAVYDADCAGTQTLNPTPLYGVGPYTYNWSTGGTGATEVVPGTIGTYTCVVTDACGTAVTATFDIGCPLSVNVEAFSATAVQGGNKLNWKLEDVKGIKDFEIERASDGQSWSALDIVSATDQQDYVLFDRDPLIGENYYRIIFHKEDATEEQSEIVMVEYVPQIEVFPNPSSDIVNVVLKSSYAENAFIVIYDILGREMMRLPVNSSHETVNIENLDNGNYMLRLEVNNELIEAHRITKR